MYNSMYNSMYTLVWLNFSYRERMMLKHSLKHGGTSGRIKRQKMFSQSNVSQPVAADCRLTAVQFQPMQVCKLQAAVKCIGKATPLQA